jgi:RNA polymerase sigma-70 factor (ECF subfamily)
MVERARDGQRDAWEHLYRNVYPRLHAYAVRHAGANVGEDLVNETMARAVAAIHRFRWEAGGFDAWLFGILRRVCAEHQRRLGRRRRELTFEPTTNGSEPGDDIERAEDYAEVRRAFELLSSAERELLELRLIAGLSADDVARLLGKRAGAVRTAQSRALANLRRLMDQPR